MKTNWTNFRKVKISKATEIRSGLFQIITDCYWIVTPDEEILFYKVGGANSPQCNQNESLAKSIRDRIHEGLEVYQIPVIYIPINPRDYC